VAIEIKKEDDYFFTCHTIGTCSYFDADSATRNKK
jgi:hypothetical protein